MNSSFLIGAGFGIVAIATLLMVWVWVGVALEKREGVDRRFRIVAWAMALSSGSLGVLCINRALEEIWGYGFAPAVVYTMLVALGLAKVSVMSSSAVDGDRRLVLLFVILMALWLAVSAWRTFA